MPDTDEPTLAVNQERAADLMVEAMLAGREARYRDGTLRYVDYEGREHRLHVIEESDETEVIA